MCALLDTRRVRRRPWRWHGMRLAAALGCAILPGMLAPACAFAAAPARLEVHGSSLAPRENVALFSDALRAPGESTRTRAALGALVARLQSLGYLDARAAASWDVREPRLVVTVSEGGKSTIGSIVIESPAFTDSSRFAHALALAPGEPASPVRIAERIAHTVDEVSATDYPYAVLGVRGWDADSGRVRLRLSGALGPQVVITQVRIDGLDVTRPDVARRAMGHLTGLPYRRAAADDARDRLEALGLFRRVTYEGLEGEGDWSRAHLVYHVVEPRYNEFEGVVGVQGQAGTAGLLRLELQNLVGTGRALGLRWESRGHGVSQFSAHASEPQLFGQPLRLELLVDQEVQDTIYVQTRWGARIVYALSGRQRVEAGIEGARVVSEHDVVEEADLQTTHFAFERATLDPSFDTRRGTRVRVSGTQTFKDEHLRPSGVQRANSSAGEIDVEWRHPTGRATGVSLELRSAGRFGSEPVLPLYEQYPIGGATTLRGYDEEQFRVDRFALSRLEWGRVLGGGGQWVYLFWDHASMATRVALEAGATRLDRDSKDGVGFGLRLETAGGWVGLDYGLAPGLTPLEGKIHVRLISRF